MSIATEQDTVAAGFAERWAEQEERLLAAGGALYPSLREQRGG